MQVVVPIDSVRFVVMGYVRYLCWYGMRIDVNSSAHIAVMERFRERTLQLLVIVVVKF
jgi:hypothetical protein